MLSFEKRGDNMNKEINQLFDETKTILNYVDDTSALEYATWTKDKAKMKFQKKTPCFPITNNFIYWCNLGINIGSEQNKIRPAIIVRTQTNSPICTILPLTSVRLNDNKWYHVDLEQKNSTAMIEQVKNISKLRVLNPKRTNGIIERIVPKDLENINKALGNYYKLQNFPAKTKKL